MNYEKRNKDFLVFLMLLLSFCLINAGSTSALPVEIQADKYYLAAREAANEKHFEEAAEYFKKVLELNVQLPMGFRFHYGRTLFRLGRYRLAIDNLNRYIDRTGKEGEYYQRALELLVAAENGEKKEQTKIEAAEKKRKEEEENRKRFLDNGNGTITDTKTWLMWTQKDSYNDFKKCVNWDDAKKYVRKLTTGGYKDWRLPRVDELKGIYDKNFTNKDFGERSIHLPSLFEPGGAYWLWSSEEAGFCCAYLVGFRLGASYRVTTQNCSYEGVRAVRYIGKENPDNKPSQTDRIKEIYKKNEEGKLGHK